MKCKRARLEISLWITEDSKDSSVTELLEHLDRCAECDIYNRNLRESHSNMQANASFTKLDPNDSIWPNLAKELPDYREMRKRKRFNGWMVATAFTMACAAMVTFSGKHHFPKWSGEVTSEIDGDMFSPAAHRIDSFDEDSMNLPLDPRFPLRYREDSIEGTSTENGPGIMQYKPLFINPNSTNKPRLILRLKDGGQHLTPRRENSNDSN